MLTLRQFRFSRSPRASSLPRGGSELARGERLNLHFVVLAVALCCCAGFLFFYGLTDRDLWSSHEGRAAQDAQTILATGQWGLPKLLDGHPELQKPPLYYWLVALAARVAGGTVDAWAVRLPAALSALGFVLLLCAWLAWRGRPLAGLFAASVLATALHYTWLARVGRIDMPLTFTVGVALGAFFLAGKTQRPLVGFAVRLAGYLAIAAGLMLKGPIGAVLPLAVLAVHAAVEGEWRQPSRLLRASWWWGVPLVLLLTVPWYWWANAHTDGEFFRVFFWVHNVERGFGDGDGPLRAYPWWFYGPQFLGEFLPWSPVLLLAVGYAVRQGGWREDAECRFGLVWLASILVLLSCLSFKRADYLLPAFPGAALFLGCAGERWYRSLAHPGRWLTGFAAVVVGVCIGWWAYLDHVLPQREPEREQRTFAAEVRRHVPAPQPVLFFRAESHALAFHVGQPLATFLEWENLEVWAGMPGVHYILMPPSCAAEWQQHVTAGSLEEVLRNTNLATGIPEHQQLVLVRTVPRAGR